MQEIADRDAFDVVCALSWTIHYCESQAELDNVVSRCRDALRPGGLLVLQVADDRQMTGAVNIDREAGPSGEPDDTLLIHRFRPQHDEGHTVIADYVYASCAGRELLSEQHQLRSANPSMITATLQRVGLRDVRVVNEGTLSPFVTGRQRRTLNAPFPVTTTSARTACHAPSRSSRASLRGGQTPVSTAFVQCNGPCVINPDYSWRPRLGHRQAVTEPDSVTDSG